jgi:Domain of unknown function (DUF4214)
MGPTSGYSWTSTSQWSQLPTVPANTDPNAVQSQQAPAQQQSSNATYNQPQQAPSTGYGALPETRRDMITRLYQRILGREPDSAGLNYYLFNTQIAELQIAREMYESTEHQDLLAKAKDIREMVKKMEANNGMVRELEMNFKNAQILANNYKTLVDQKSHIINDLRSQLNLPNQENFNTAPQTMDEPNVQYDHRQEHSQAQPDTTYDEYVEGVVLNDPFADDYQPKGKGCFGWVKKWFSFK